MSAGEASQTLSDCDTCIDCPPECTGEPPPPPPPPPTYPDGLYFDKMRVWEDGEGWPRGQAELEVHIFGHQKGIYTLFEYPVDDVQSVGDLTYNATAKRQVHGACAGEKASGLRKFNFDGEGGKVFNEVVLFSEGPDLSVIERIRNRHGHQIHRRRSKLVAPFVIAIIERDDGQACPTPPASLVVKWGIDFQFNPYSRPNADANLDVVERLLGNENETVALWTFSSYAALEAFSNTFKAAPSSCGTGSCDGKADIWLTNRGFRQAQVPPSKDPY